MSELSAPKLKTFKLGEVIFKEGEVGDKTYIIKKGLVKIIAQHDDKSVTLGVLKNGACFGEMAVIADVPRVATAICDVQSQIYIIDKVHIDNMMAEMSPLFRAIILSLIKRVKSLNVFAAEKASFSHPMISVAHLIELMPNAGSIPETTSTNNFLGGSDLIEDTSHPAESEIFLKELVKKLKDILGYTDHGANNVLQKFIKLRLARIETVDRKQYFICSSTDFVASVKEVIDYLDDKDNVPTAELEYVDLEELAEQLDLRPQRLLDAIYNGRISQKAILMRRHVVMNSIKEQGRQMF